MKTCNLSIESELALIERFGLTPNELFILRLLILAKAESTQTYLFRFLQGGEANKSMVRDCLYSLQAKGIILKAYDIPEEGQRFVPKEVLFSKSFDKNYEKASLEMGRELFSVYPMFALINGVMVPIKTVSKHFNSIDDAYRFYGKTIKYNQELHNHIIELVKWAVDNTNIINCSFSSFLINNFWETLDAIKDGDQGNINFDTVRLL